MWGMEIEFATPTGEALAAVGRALDAAIADDRSLLSPAERLAVLSLAVVEAGRLQSLLVSLVGEAEATEAAMVEVGGTTRGWLTDTHRLSPAEAGGLVKQAARLQRFPLLREATLDGGVRPQQASAITRVLDTLPDDFSHAQVAAAEVEMVVQAATFHSVELGRLGRHLLDCIATEVGEAAEAQRLERELEMARKGRGLTFTDDGHGSTHIKGYLPTADAELLRVQVEAIARHRHRSALEVRDPLAPIVTPTQHRADALVELARLAALHQDAPAHGGDRPRISVVIDYDSLLSDCVGAGLVERGVGITAEQLRLLACDADILPAVLDGEGVPLDVGRTKRLVPPDLRVALVQRDRGCVFPGCDRPPTHGDAHHIVPWVAGGETSLANCVLVCRHHHNLVEPHPNAPPGSRWEIRLGPDGLPEVLPPTRVDPARAPRRHVRFGTVA